MRILTSVHSLPYTAHSARSIAFLGEPITVALEGGYAPTFALTSAPGGSAASLTSVTESAQFAPDVAGSYVVTVTDGAHSASATVIAAPASLLTWGPFANKPTADVVRILTAYVRDARCDVAALEAGSLPGVRLTEFGG